MSWLNWLYNIAQQEVKKTAAGKAASGAIKGTKAAGVKGAVKGAAHSQVPSLLMNQFQQAPEAVSAAPGIGAQLPETPIIETPVEPKAVTLALVCK